MKDLPTGWAEATLEDLLAPEAAAITDGPFGSNLKTEHYTEEGPRVIRLQNIGDGAFRDERAHISADRFEALKKHEARAGDIVIAALGEVLPRSCVVPAGIESAIVKADCIRARVHPSINPRFVNAMLNSPAVRRAATAEISGVGRPRLNLGKIRSIRLPIPPSAEQDRIVVAIEEQFSRLKNAVTMLSAAHRNGEAFIEARTRAAVQGELVTFSELLVEPLANGRSVPTATGSGFPVLRLTALRNGEIDLGERKTGAWSRADAERFLVRRGDFFISRGNGSLALVGRGGLVGANPDDVAFPDTMIRARVDPGRMDLRFLRIVWNAPTTRKQLETSARTTAGIYKVNQQDLARTRLPVPPLEVQRNIVADMEAETSVVAAVLTAIDHAKVRSEHLRRAVLQRAFSGKLVAQDPNDEPASALLDRIAATHATAEKPERRKRA